MDTTHCKPCSPGCKKCKNNAECLSCGPGLLLVGNSCQTQCPAGQFRSKANSCEPCDGMCKECVLSSSNCIQCQEHEVLSGGQCVSICPVGTFLLQNTKSCAPCHSSCKSCTGPSADDCTGCGSASVMVNSRCLASCPSDYFFDKEANSCQPCDYYCSTCKGGRFYNISLYKKISYTKSMKYMETTTTCSLPCDVCPFYPLSGTEPCIKKKIRERTFKMDTIPISRFIQ